MAKKKYRLRNLNIDRVDLVDKGANQYAEIVLAKRDMSKQQPDLNDVHQSTIRGKRKKLKEMMMANEKKLEKHAGPGPHPSGSSQEVHAPNRGSGTIGVSGSPGSPNKQKRNLAAEGFGRDEYPGSRPKAVTIKDDATPYDLVDGKALARAKAQPRKKKPTAGTGRTDPDEMKRDRAARALRDLADPYGKNKEMADRLRREAGLTKADISKRTPGIARALRALAAAKKRNKARMARGEAPIVAGEKVSPSSLSKSVLDIITKGLIEADVFVEDATGDDLHDMLPDKVNTELEETLSAESAMVSEEEDNMADELDAFDLPDEVIDYIDELETAVADLSKSLEELDKLDDEEEYEDEDDERIAKALGELPEDVAAILKADREAAQVAKAEADEKIEKAAIAEYIAKAATYAGVVDSAEEFGPMLRKIAAWDEDVATTLETVLESATARLAKSKLFEEAGHKAPGEGSDAFAKATTIAKGYVESGTESSIEAARGRVWKENPELFDEYQAERRAERIGG